MACPALSMADDLTLWYNRPAGYWVEALPLGNGRLGAMVYGGTASDTIQLNEDTYWSGSPYNNYNPKALAALPKIREALNNGDYETAQRLSLANITADRSITAHGAAYASVGNLVLTLPGHDKATHYRRDLNLEEAVASVNYESDGVNFTREYFTSLADQVTVIRLTASKAGALDHLKVSFAGPLKEKRGKAQSYWIAPDLMRVYTQPGMADFENVPNGLHCSTYVKVVRESATSTLLLVSSATNFVNYKDITADSEAKAMGYLQAVLDQKLSYDQLRQRHTDLYRKQFGRVRLDLGENPAQTAKPTDQRIAEFSETSDPSLASMYFQFGRYLLIASSQPGSQPANLQGIWNPDGGQYPAWDSKYTININLEMNYWPAEVTNLSECHEPMLQLIDDVSHTGQQSARYMYGARGWTLHHNTDLWRSTGAVDYASCSVWPTAGAWFCSHLWEHYLYTGDLDYLQRAYPILKGAAQFYQDFLSRDKATGYLVASPSHSPENHPGKWSYTDDNGKKQSCAIFQGVTMDNQMIYDLLRSTILATEELGIDTAFADSLKDLQRQLPPMHIGKYGQMQEWLEDWDRETTGHRHISHLWGFYPGNMISPFRHPQLFQASRKTLIGRGDNSRGWSMGWKVCLWARMLDGNHAYTLIENQLKLKDPNITIKDPNGGTYANMFDAHPPFQIDGNFGCCAGIAEMLVQSHNECVHLLPALPDVWSEGRVEGLRVRGGFVIKELAWSKGRVTRLVVESTLGGNLRLRSAAALSGRGLKKAKGDNANRFFRPYDNLDPVIVDPSRIPALELPATHLYDVATQAGQTYTFTGK